jgi:TBC1 domain family member 10
MLNHREFYKMFLEQGAPTLKSKQWEVEHLIIKDVPRTFSGLKLFDKNPSSGGNSLFNLLKAYSIYDPDVGYTQGMSFIAALILMLFDQDEAVAWTVFVKILSEKNDWRRFYGENTPKLFEFTKVIREWIKKDLPRLNRVLNEHNVILESLFASPLLTLFGNLIPIE